MATRNLGTTTALKNSLIANEEYGFFHLVKFEKPKDVTAPGFSSGKAANYAYITDSSINIEFNDGSKDSKDVANGPQTYIANKLLSVGTINETTDAKASNMTVTMSGTALGTIVQTNAAFTTSSMTTTTDLVDAGFQEGDVLLLESTGNTNNNKYIRIDTFTNGNQTVAFSNIDSTIDADSTNRTYTLSFASEEISALINNKDSGTTYSGYMNREVFIYRAHYRTETEYAANGTTIVNHAGSIIGEPFLIFRGIISKGSVADDVLKSSKVSWNLTSHWGDFVRVQGRHTSDAAHRALSITGVPDTEAILRPEYASDFGFVHAERSVNVLATYQVQETRYKMKKRGGLAGLFGGKKTVEYQVEVDREVDLQFNLQAKYLPVVYGVQKVDSIPIFADTLKDSVTAVSGSNTVFVAHAICEGEISGIYDIHVEDSSTICIDANDASVRDGGSAAVEVVCYGRADRGDVLSGQTAYGNPAAFFDSADEDFVISPGAAFLGVNASTFALLSGSGLNFPGGQTDSGNGLQHEDTFTLTSPISTTLTIHTGKEDQRANNTLTTTAKANNFKLQNDFGDVSKANYWSPSHRLLDTAYVVGKYVIGEGETTIPKLEFIVKGKKIETYNYDYSYENDPAIISADHSNFSLGDTVTLHNTSNGSSLGTVTIIDKWSYYKDSSSLDYRFRFSANPQVAAGTTAFYMLKGTNRWYMTTYDHKTSPTAATLPTQLAATVTSIANAATGTMTVNLATNTNPSFLNTLAVGHYVTFTYGGSTSASFQVRSRSGTAITVYNSGVSVYAINTAISNPGTTVVMNNLNVITLNSSANGSNDTYNFQNITITQYDSTDVILKQQVKLIADYIGTTRQATLLSPIPPDFILGTTDRYIISAGKAVDTRVSTNPALQLLDYLKNDRYGKGLTDSDINLPTFLQAARDCDTRSDVTVQLEGIVSLTDGDVYKYVSSASSLLFQGTVKSSFSRVVAVPQSDDSTTDATYTEVTFTDVIGKLGYKWNNYRVFNTGELYWHKGKAYTASSTSAIATAPTSGHLTDDIDLTKVGGGTAITVSITDGFSASGNPIVKKFTNIAEGFNSPGYSLYDSDDVKYWIYVGWDEPEQRFVTRHQLNQIIDTANPLFDNINSMLKQFNGIMRYANGKYELAVKSAAPAPSTFESFETITDGDIIGKIKIQDKGQKGIYNSMSANVVDPQNKFNARAITYFNSEYLKQDKGIRKSGNFKMPGVSNYFNSRVNIQQFLDESRYGLGISFTIDSKGYLLLTGEIIRITYERFGWENKYFRIDNLNFQSNGLVQVTATEHNDNAFLVGNIKSSQETAVLESEGSFVNAPIIATPASPSALAATTNGKGSIAVTWNNSSTFKFSTHNTEVWASSTNNRSSASLVYTTQATNMDHIIVEQSLTSKYYWIRHQVVTDNGLIVPSAYFPVGSTAGILGSATGAIDGDDGARGAGRWHIQVTSLPTTSALANSRWADGSGNQPSAAVIGDQVFFYKGTLSNPTAQSVWIYEGSGTWNEQEEVIDGDLIVNGTITADHISATSAEFKELVVDVGTFTTLNTTMLDSDAIVTRDIRVGPSAEVTAGSFVVGTEYYITDLGNTTQAQWNTTAGTSGATYTIGSIFTAANVGTGTGKARNRTSVAKIAGTTLTGSGAHLNSGGDFYLGNASANKYVFWDQSAGTMTLRGNLNAGDINAGTLTAVSVKGGSMPDANAAPQGTESGAFMDLGNGKVVFGNATKHILFDGTNLVLNGVTIDATSVVNSTAGIVVQEDGTEEAATATTLNFTTGLNSTTGTGAAANTVTISIDDNNVTNASVSGDILTLTRAGSAADVTFTNTNTTVIPDNNVTGASVSGNTLTLTLEGSAADVTFNDTNTTVIPDNNVTGASVSGNTLTLTLEGSAADVTFNDTNTTVIPDNNVTGASVSGNTLTLTLEGSAADVTFNDTNTTVIPDNNVTGASVSGNTLTLTLEGSAADVTFSDTDTNTVYTAGTGLDLSAGNEFSVDNSVVVTSGDQTIAGDKTFSNNITVDGNLTVSGTTTTLDTENLLIEDNIIIVNSAQAGTPATTVTAGLQVERGDSTNKNFLWAETGLGPSSNLAGWTFGSENVKAGTFYGTFVGDITGTPSSLAGLTTDNLAEGASNLYFTDARARSAMSVATGLDKSATGEISLDLSELTDMTEAVVGTEDELIILDNGTEKRKLTSEITLSDFNNDSSWTSNAGTVTSISSGTGLTGGPITGSGTLNVSGLTVTELAAGSLQISSEAFADNDTSLMTSAAIQDKIEAYGYTTLAIGTSATTALAGNTSLLALGTTSTTALAGDTSLLAIGTTSTTALAGNTSLFSGSYDDLTDKPTLLAIGTTATTALAGNTSLLAIGTTATTALAGNTSLLAIGTTATTALAGNTSLFSGSYNDLTDKPTLLAIGTSATTALAGNTSLLAIGTSATTALAGNTSLLALGTTATTALAGNTTIPQGTVTSVTATANTGLTVTDTTTTPVITLDPTLTTLGAASIYDTKRRDT